MLTEIAPGVLVHESACIQSNTVVVEGDDGVLLVDPGITETELRCLVADLGERGAVVVAAFATHPDWDHVLWIPELGDAPRYGTERAAAETRALRSRPGWRDEVDEGLPPEVAGEVPMEQLGLLAGLPAGAGRIPWNGPEVRVVEHRAHAPGHAALVIADRGVLVAGDMLSDVLVPMPDPGADDPLGDYLAALARFDGLADGITAVVPGHGSVGDADELRDRIAADRAYIEALREDRDSQDARIGPEAKPGWEWVAWLHEGQAERLRGR